jgi:hypothetical protein
LADVQVALRQNLPVSVEGDCSEINSQVSDAAALSEGAPGLPL